MTDEVESGTKPEAKPDENPYETTKEFRDGYRRGLDVAYRVLHDWLMSGNRFYSDSAAVVVSFESRISHEIEKSVRHLETVTRRP